MTLPPATPSLTYYTHTRTPEELKDEVVTDLRKRLTSLERRHDAARNPTEKAKVAHTIAEFREMLDFWSAVEIRRGAKRASRVKPASPDGVLRPSSTDHDGD